MKRKVLVTFIIFFSFFTLISTRGSSVYLSKQYDIVVCDWQLTNEAQTEIIDEAFDFHINLTLEEDFHYNLLDLSINETIAFRDITKNVHFYTLKRIIVAKINLEEFTSIIEKNKPQKNELDIILKDSSNILNDIVLFLEKNGLIALIIVLIMLYFAYHILIQ